MERAAIGPHVASHQLQRCAAGEKIEHEHGDIRKDGEVLKSGEEGEDRSDRAIGQDRDVRRMETRMNMRESFGRKRSRPKAKRMRGELRMSLARKPNAEMLAPVEHQIAAGFTEKAGGGLRQGRGGKFSEAVSEDALRDQLDEQVKHGRDGEREVDRARDGARGILHFAARHERDFNSDERKEKQEHSAAETAGHPARRSLGHRSA